MAVQTDWVQALALPLLFVYRLLALSPSTFSSTTRKRSSLLLDVYAVALGAVFEGVDSWSAHLFPLASFMPT